MPFQVQSLWEHHIKFSIQSSPATRANLCIGSPEPFKKSLGVLCFIPSEYTSTPVETVNDKLQQRGPHSANPRSPNAIFSVKTLPHWICGKVTFLPVVLDCDWPSSCTSSVLAGMCFKSQDPETDPNVCISSGILSKQQKERNSTRTELRDAHCFILTWAAPSLLRVKE